MSPDTMKALGERIIPVMQEHGLSAFVIVGYAEDGEGNLRRVCIANTGPNPAFQDGLRPVIAFAHAWGSDPVRHQQPQGDVEE